MLLRLKIFRRLIDLKPWVALVVIAMSGSACQRIVEIDIEERKPRLVVDFRKVNEHLVPDRLPAKPIP